MLALVGFLIIIVMMLLIFRSKALPAFCFAVLPIIGALICGFSLADISDFIGKGVGSTWQTAILFIFSVTYFGIMNDAGLFDKLVDGLVKKAGKNITLILIFTSIIAMIGHIDGAAATTYLITIPTMLPIYKKMHIRPTVLLLLCGAATGIMNLVPWGGVLNRQSVTLAMDSGLLWRAYLPMQIFGWFCCVGLAVVMSRIEVRRGAGKVAVLAAGESAEAAADPEVLALQRPKLLWYNVILTVAVFVLLFKTSLPNYSIFMMGCVLALAVNYPNPKDQEARLAAHAPKVISLVATVLSAGVMVGVLNNTGMIVAMAELIIHILPDFLCAHLHLVFAFFGGFIGLAVSPDPLYYGILPVLIEVCAQYGIPAQSVAIAFGIGADSCFTLAPVIASTYLGLAVSGLSLKEHMRFSFFPLWIVGLLMIAFGCVMGYIVI